MSHIHARDVLRQERWDPVDYHGCVSCGVKITKAERREHGDYRFFCPECAAERIERVEQHIRRVQQEMTSLGIHNKHRRKRQG